MFDFPPSPLFFDFYFHSWVPLEVMQKQKTISSFLISSIQPGLKKFSYVAVEFPEFLCQKISSNVSVAFLAPYFIFLPSCIMWWVFLSELLSVINSFSCTSILLQVQFTSLETVCILNFFLLYSYISHRSPFR